MRQASESVRQASRSGLAIYVDKIIIHHFTPATSSAINRVKERIENNGRIRLAATFVPVGVQLKHSPTHHGKMNLLIFNAFFLSLRYLLVIQSIL